MNKSELRRIYLQKRQALSPDDISENSRQIADRFFREFDFTAIETLHCFISIPRLREIDTALIYKRIWADFPHVRVVAPRMNAMTGEIDSVSFTCEAELVENDWGIREPAGSEMIDPFEIDAILVPVLCYDRKGNRVGYGKGFYDKFLARCRGDCRKVGLSLFPPVDTINNVGEHDVPLDHCLTPDTFYSFSLGPRRPNAS